MPAGSRTPGATTNRSADLLAALHDRFGGQANLAVLAADGTPHHYAGNGENPVFTFRLGRIGLASTGIYSLDRSLFRFVAPGATERRLVRQRIDRCLDRNGSAISSVLGCDGRADREGSASHERWGALLMTARPTRPSVRPADRAPAAAHLLRLSLYWLGLIAIVARLGRILQERHQGRVVARPRGQPVHDPRLSIQVAGVIIAVLVQPTAGSISDYTISRLGRRKPYILIGSLLDVVFLVGIATSNTVLALAAFVVLLQFSANFAQGPFQGYVPDLVPAPQVGLASALVGLMQSSATSSGPASPAIGVVASASSPGLTIALGIIELVTMLSLFFRVGEGRPPSDRGGRSGDRSPGEAWGTDVLKERSFMFLVASRFFVLMAAAASCSACSAVPRACAWDRRGTHERGRLDLRDDGHRGLCTVDRHRPAASCRTGSGASRSSMQRASSAPSG